jgi:hypothetical protein
MAKLAADVGSVFLLFVLFWATGTLVAAALRLERADLPRPTTTVLGMAAWMVVTFTLAAIGQLARPVVLALAVLLLAAGLAVAAWKAPARGWVAGPRPDSKRLRWVAGLALAPPLLVLAALFALASIPTVVGDESSAQLTLPKLYIHYGGFRQLHYSVYSNWPQAMNLLYAVAMLLRDFVLAKLTHWLCLALLLVAVHDYCRDWSGRLAAWVALPLCMANPVVLFEGSLAYLDLAVALFFFQAFVSYDAWRRGAASGGWLAGVFCGVACGIKLTGVFVPIALCGLVAVDAIGQPGRGRLQAFLCGLLPIAIPCTALAAPWYIRSYLYTGNPVYPFLYGVFGGSEWSAELSRQMMAWHQSMGMGRSLTDYLLLPVRVLLYGGPGYEHFSGRLSPAWIVLVPLAVGAARSDATVRRCLGVAGLYFVLWAVSSQQARFLIPILPLLATAVGVSLARPAAVGGRRDRPGAGWAAAAAAVAVVGLANGTLLWHARFTLRQLPQTIATIARLSADPAVAREFIKPVDRFVRESLPADATVILFNTNHGFFLDRAYIADAMFEASQLSELLWRDPSDVGVAQTLKSLGVTHVLWDDVDWGTSYPAGLLALLGDPQRAAPLYRSPDDRYRVYALR